VGKIIELPLTFDPEDLLAQKGIGFDPDFHIFTSGIEADRQNPRLVHMIGSSTEKDLQGDTMSLLALSDMTKAPSNMTIWLNHDYNLPDSIFGSVVGSPSIFHKDGVADLQLAVDVEMDNPQAARVKKYIDNGRKLGCSIGCMVTKYEVPTEEDGERWFENSIIIHGVYVVEYSVVGIPCNQRSWVENAVRGVFSRTFNPDLAPAMKSLWPSAYRKAVKGLSQEHREELDRLPARTRSDYRLEWQVDRKTFSFLHGNVVKEMNSDEVRTMLLQESLKKTGQVAPEVTEEVEPEETKGVCGSTSWSLDMESSWEKGSAHHRLLDWAGGKEDFSPSKFKSVHFRYEGDGQQISDYHFPFCDIKDGSPEAIWHAITAAASALDGARGGANTEGDTAGMRKKLAAYYHKAGKTAPWEDGDSDKSLEDAEVVEKGDQPELTQSEAEVITKEQDMPPAESVSEERKVPEATPLPSVAVELPAHTLALLSSYNMLAKSLSLPEIDPDRLAEAQETALLQRSVSGLGSPDMQRLQAIHDMVAAMTNGQVCEGYEDDDQDDDDVSGNGPLAVSYDLTQNVALLSKSIGEYHQATVDLFDLKKDAEIAKKELGLAQEQIATLAAEVEKAQHTISALKDMPLGNPVMHNRTVHADDSVVSHEEMLRVQQSTKAEAVATDSLPAALGLTQIKGFSLADGRYMKYRCWPDGVGGSVKNGVRPELTSDQISMMSFTDIYSYREGREAKVPYLGDPVANGQKGVTNL
jgi:hypothetical protein